MKLKPFLIAGALALTSLMTMSAQSLDNPLVRAVMAVYDEAIAENPGDYEALLRRGNEYYNLNMYRQALDDVNQAMRYIPNDDKDSRFRALGLRARVYSLSNRYAEAITDLNEALEIDPKNYVITYLRADAYYNLGNYNEAKNDFNTMLRINPRSQEAMFGLAKIAIKQNNLGVANDFADKAVNLTPSNSDVYLSRAEVRRLAGDNQGAVDDYIIALSIDSGNSSRALRELFLLSNSDYAAVMNGLTSAIRRAPRQGMFYYIRASIAQSHSNYRAAIDDYDKIINEKMYVFEGLNASLAECYFALGKYETALMNIDYAIEANPDNASYYVIKSQILRATGDYQGALRNAESALEKAPDDNDALQAIALALESLELYQDASVTLSEAILNNSSDPYLLMLRGWILTDYRNQPDVAKTCYERVIELDYDFDQVRSLKGFALLFLGKDDEAEQWMNTILNTVDDTDGLVNYYATCFFAQKGMKDIAFRHMQQALERGYANYNNWVNNNDARINVAPLRNDPRFQQLLDKYVILFK